METISHECYVSFEVVKLLKEAEFDWKCNGVFLSEDGTQYAFIKSDAACDNNNSKYNLYNISAPTLEVAQRWLREIKNVVLLVDFNNDEDCEENERYGVTIYIAKERIIELATYPTYEEAQEVGIKKAIEIILEKGE